jgi:uncharacterized protein YabN with tetrapyrrole methylase and pyrophosphatase domain
MAKRNGSKQKMCDEIGDYLFSILALFCEFNMNAQEALQNTLSKYDLRFAKKGDVGSND